MKKLLILSGKGGTGKTTVASAFIKLAKAKAYADCDVDAPNLHLVLERSSELKVDDFYGLPKAEIDAAKCIKCGSCKQYCRFDAVEDSAEYTIDPYACEGCGVCAELCPVGAITLRPDIAGELKLYTNDAVFSTAKLRMGSGTSGKLVTDVKNRMNEAAKEAPLAIIDGSPGIGCPVIASMSGVDMVLIVTEPTLSGISDLRRILKTAEVFHTKTAVCVNKYDTNRDKTAEIEIFCKSADIPITGFIPYDTEAVKAVNNGRTIVDIDCPAGTAVKKVYNETIKKLYQS